MMDGLFAYQDSQQRRQLREGWVAEVLATTAGLASMCMPSATIQW
jgi:hypothetical protein